MSEDERTRLVVPGDWDRVQGVLPSWWEGRDLRALLPRLFFHHFRTTSFVVEHEGELVAFFVGFLCPTHDDEAYIHFVGVHPAHRGRGVARSLYERFFGLAIADGRTLVRAVTAAVNAGSVGFHRHMGFEVVPGDGEIDGIPVWFDYEGPGEHRVRFELRIATWRPAPEP